MPDVNPARRLQPTPCRAASPAAPLATVESVPEAPAAADLEALLEGLNEPQRDAVTYGEGPLLILAGAGSGKTRVLTHRIAYLMRTNQARASEILAITFTNRAAQEMRERVELLVGARTRAMWVMTFHAACARMLRADAHRLGYTRQFTIYDQADSRRMVKRCLTDLDVDPKRFTPAAVQSQISDAKNKLRSAEDYRGMVGSFFEQTVADVYEVYEQEMHRANALDFDDLLVRAVNVLELFPEVRDRYRTAFRHVLVDEYQDTNHVQYRWLQLLAGEGTGDDEPGHRNLAVVGDDDQCLTEGTLITMADGSQRPIEQVKPGDQLLSSYGSGDLHAARVSGIFVGHREDGVRITTRDGRVITSTPEHTHFAGFRAGHTPQKHLTYVMRRAGVGCRVGTTRTYNTRAKKGLGLATRALQEHADSAWVVSQHLTDAEARVAEAQLSLRYQLPMLPFKARPGARSNGVVGDQALIDRVFASVDSDLGGLRLLHDMELSPEHPHHAPASYEGRRRNVTVTLCANGRGAMPLHAITIGGRGAEVRERLESIDLTVRPARLGSQSWRYEASFTDFGQLMRTVERIRSVIDVVIRHRARLGAPEPGRGNSLPFTPAGTVAPGMAMFAADGSYDVVETVERVALDDRVYDLNVEGTHNFIANGLITHNSIYAFRGADIRNVLEFQDDFVDAKVVRLEQNYRSTQRILDSANAVIEHNRGRMGKTLFTELGEGDPIKVRELDDEHAEARFVAGEVQRLVDEGVSREEVAVFYRTNAQSRVLEDTLVRADIGYQVIGGTKFYERAEIKDALAYLTVLLNGQDTVSFMRIANSPRRGIGQTSLSRLVSFANTTGSDIFAAAADPEQVPALAAAAVKALGRFMRVMITLRERVEGGASAFELLDETLRQTGYIEALEAERTIEAQGRIENLEELLEVAREYDGTAEAPTVAEFLEQLALRSDADALRDDEALVTLMTLHNAKGLEYPIVFMIGCEDGVFPHSRALEEGGLEEERRLCYVGITRAQRDLYITYARTRNVFGSRTYGLRSRFIDEIPEQLTDAAEQLRTSRAPGVSSGGGRGVAPSWVAAAGDAPASTPEFRLGDDVSHAAFGEGVGTGIEPGGIVVVRFAGDGSERKLMAAYAPITKR